MLSSECITHYTTTKGICYATLQVSFQLLGQPLGKSPIVLVFHALTGDSDVCHAQKGWWNRLIGLDKCIDLNRYTVISFNLLGNGYRGEVLGNYKDFTARDMAILSHKVLRKMKVNGVYAIIGGSLGGGIVWEFGALFPTFSKYLIPVATDWKATDWIIALSSIQESILLCSSKCALENARKMAMLFYRNPQSIKKKFNRKTDRKKEFEVNLWLNHHGEKLKNRFSKPAYLMMNHLLSTIDITENRGAIDEVLKNIDSTVIQIGIDTDILFDKNENKLTKKLLDQLNIKNEYFEIKSDCGHDAFLTEQEQIANFLSPYFNA